MKQSALPHGLVDRYSVNATIFFYHWHHICQYHSSIADYTCYSIRLFSSHILHTVFPLRNNLNFILGYNPVLTWLLSPYQVGRSFFSSIASYLDFLATNFSLQSTFEAVCNLVYSLEKFNSVMINKCLEHLFR